MSSGPATPAPAAGPARARRRLAPALASLALVLTLAGCHIPGTSSASPGSVKTLTVAAVPGIDTAPLWLAAKGGPDSLFARYNVRVRIDTVTSDSQAIAALRNGGADIAASDYGELFFVPSASRLFKIIADGYDAQPGVLEIVTLPGSHITSAADLAGQRIGAPDDQAVRSPAGTPDSLPVAAATSVMQSFGVNMTTVSWDVMKPSAEISALRNHLVEAILVTEPYLYQAESELGAVQVLDAYSGATAGLPLTGYFSTAAGPLQNPSEFAAFRSALQQAEALAATPGPVQGILPRQAAIKAQEAALVTLGTYPTTTDIANVQRVAALLELQSMIGRSVSVTAMLWRPPPR